MHRRTSGLFLVALLLAAAPAWAQQPIEAFIGRRVAEVRVEIQGEVQVESALVALVDVRVGEPLSVTAIRGTMDNFGRLARFEDARFLVDEGPVGLVVIIVLEPRLPIERLAFEGSPGLAVGELERRVRDLYGGLPPPTANLRNIERVVERALADEGYLLARARADTVRVAGTERSTLVVTVEAGPRAVVSAVRIDNQSPLSDRQIRERTGVAVGSPYRPRAISTALAGLRDDLSQRGYYSAYANPQVTESNTRTSVEVELLVGAGPRIRVEWAGDPRPPGNVNDLVPIQREGSADEDLLEDADALIRTALTRDGYRDASVYHTREEQGDELVITFHVSRGRRSRVERIDIPAGLALDADTIRRALGVEVGDAVDDARVLQGMSRVALEYQRLGYYQVSVVPEYTEEVTRSTEREAWLVVHPTITEGPRGLLTSVQITHVAGDPQVPVEDLRAVMRSQPGGPYSVAAVYFDRIDLETLYQNQGFRTARVEVLEPVFSDDGTAVALVLRVTEGPQIIVGEITVVGNRRVSADTILQRIALKVGEPIGPARINDSRRSLAELGISRVSFTEQQRPAGDNVAHVVVSVDEAPATTIGYGGGVEVATRPRSVAGSRIEDVLELAPRGFVELSRRHIGGRDRTLSFFGRVSLKRATITEIADSDGVFGFVEYRTTVAYRERRAFNTDSEILFGVTSEQATRTNFNFLRRVVNAELLHRVTPTVSVSGRYGLDFTKLFDELIPPEDQPAIDRLFPQIRLSTLSTGVFWDRRDNLVSPTEGTFVTGDFEMALKVIGSQVDYVKTFFQALKLTPLTEDARFVLATRAQLGLARAGERTIDPDEPGPFVGPDVDVALDDLPASRRFFAGGGTTVRGFQLDRLGVPEILNDDGLSNGGNAVVILNAELRARLGNLFGRRLIGVGFLDGGNVFRRVSDVDLSRIRGTAGFGVRWDSPLGPLRVDAGFKLSRLVFNGRPERLWELHLSIGEAF